MITVYATLDNGKKVVKDEDTSEFTLRSNDLSQIEEKLPSVEDMIKGYCRVYHIGE